MAGLELTRVFVKVIACGSFSRAAQVLRLPKSTVSKMVSRLELDLGAQLLVRTTRAMALTPAGRTYLDACQPHVEALERARDAAMGGTGVVAGQIRITAPEDLGAMVVTPIIAELMAAHPKLLFELRYTEERVDLVRESFDLAVRLGDLPASRLRATRVGETVPVTVAAPSYLRSAPPIRHPHDLVEHTCLSIPVERTRWTLRCERELVTVNAHPRLIANQMSNLLELAIAGAGIARVPTFLCRSELRDGALLRVLPEWTGAGVRVSLVSPRPMSPSTSLGIVAQRLVVALRDALRPT